MKDRLTREEVERVSKLAKIKVRDSEMEGYQIELKKLLNEVEKIIDVKSSDDEILFSPALHECRLREDQVEEMLDPKEILKNVPRHSGNYVEVPVVIND